MTTRRQRTGPHSHEAHRDEIEKSSTYIPRFCCCTRSRSTSFHVPAFMVPLSLVLLLLRQRRDDVLAAVHALFGLIQPHDHEEALGRRGQPVGLLVLAGRVVLDEDRQATVGVGL